MATWCKELIHWKRPWSWGRLKAGKEGDREWDGWIVSLTQWTWVWANPGRKWRTGKPGMLQSMGSQRVRHDLATIQQYIYIYINNYMWIKWPFWKRPCTPGAHQANCLKVGRKIHCTFSCQNPYCPHSVVPLGGKPQFAYSSWWEKQVEFMFKTLTFKGDAWGTILHLIWIQVPTEMKGPD